MREREGRWSVTDSRHDQLEHTMLVGHSDSFKGKKITLGFQ